MREAQCALEAFAPRAHLLTLFRLRFDPPTAALLVLGGTSTLRYFSDTHAKMVDTLRHSGPFLGQLLLGHAEPQTAPFPQSLEKN
ncbi:hypothetical protein FISHEDRAFT_73181 [Fistulina hepatica ATCC 64428]|uniref:Uncharacterized protein n=1 Tax=Fistulina hepatica ATCC 64428 TaxID=1128425 RepID=A0A0D7ADG1_9AGAR|nr:hypothetical protein FISHEDRAFT_73181 [Fistulina hepatica ATCC 64428]